MLVGTLIIAVTFLYVKYPDSVGGILTANQHGVRLHVG